MDDQTLADEPAPHLGAPLPFVPATLAPQSSVPTNSDCAAHTDLSGATLGDYRLLRLLAVGGMGEVYEAVQTTLDRTVAVKLLAPQYANSPSFRERFEREAKAAAALNHPNVVQVYDFGKADERLYFVMELVDGLDLSKHVELRGKLSVAQALDAVEQVAGALRFAAERGIIHRDIKPSNLLLSSQGYVKVSDLGLAKNLTDTTADLTLTGFGIGSPHFLAPEQAEDASRVDHRADIYALGITMMFLLTGKRPFEGSSALAIVLSQARQPLPSGADLGTPLPEPIEALIRRMTAKDPADRPNDYTALLDDIAQTRAQLLAEPAGVSPRAALRIAPTTALFRESIERPAPVHRILPAPAHRVPADHRGISPGVLLLAGALFSAIIFAGLYWFRLKPLPPPDRPFVSTSLPAPDDRPNPLPPLPPSEPIPDAPAAELLRQAEAYARANPARYRDILDRLRAAEDRAAGTPLGPNIRALRSTWSAQQTAEADKIIAQYRQEMDRFAARGDPLSGVMQWQQFPDQLRSPEIDARIHQMLQDLGPPRGGSGAHPLPGQPAPISGGRRLPPPSGVPGRP